MGKVGGKIKKEAGGVGDGRAEQGGELHLTLSTGNPASSRSSLVRWAAGAGRGSVSACAWSGANSGNRRSRRRANALLTYANETASLHLKCSTIRPAPAGLTVNDYFR